MMKFFSALPVALLLATSTFAQNDGLKLTMDTLTVSATAGAPVYRASATRVWDIKHTRVALTFNWNEKTANVHEWIKLRPYFYATDTLELDAKDLRIDSVMLVGKKGNTSLKYSYQKNQLKITFTMKYKMNDTVELYLVYTATPYATPTGGSGAITDDRGLYFINTDNRVPNKPAQIWTQGESESNSHWMITIDKPNTRFTTQIELTVPDAMTTLSNGAMVRQSHGKTGMRTDTWRMNMPIQAYAVMFAIGKYSIVKDHWKNKEVNYYVEPQYEPYAKLMFNHTTEMMDFFSQRTGVPYPWNKYDQVVVRDYVSGAMENTTASLFGEFMNQNAREIADGNSEDVVSHELFHMWFGDYVTAESWTNVTVNESFANYGEQLWRAYKYGKASGDELAFNDLQTYLAVSQANDPQLVRFYYDSREEVFDAISYNKGGATLRYMNSLMGDDAFDRSMNIYLTRNALRSGEAHNWRLAVEEVTGQDWNWFFNQWYYHAGHPVLRVAYNYNDTTQKLMVTVTQAQSESQSDSAFLYQLPLKTAVIYGNEKAIIDWNINKMKETFVYDYKSNIRPVIVPDCNHVLPGELKDGKKPAQWLVQYLKSNDFIGRRLAVSAAGRLTSDSVSQVILTLALDDSLYSIRRHALVQLQSIQSDKLHKKWMAKVIAMATGDNNNKVRAEAFDVLGSWKANQAKSNMLAVLYDSSYAVAGNALEALNKIDKDTAYILAKKLLATDPRASLDSKIWGIIGRKGADEDIVLIEKKAPFVLGAAKRFPFAICLNNYLRTVSSEASFKRGVEVYATMVTNESMKQTRTMLGGFLFNVGADQKSGTKSENKEEAAAAQRKMDIVKAALDKVVAAEKDPEVQKDYKKMLKDTFE